jgi:ankyrin repeat protein
MEIRRARITGVVVVCLASLAAADAGAQAVADAAKNAEWAAVHQLIETGVDVAAAQGDGMTALHWTGYWDARDIAERLIAAGADVSVANDLGVTPLWTAAEHGSEPMITLLLAAGANPSAALPSGETVLMTAARSGSAEGVRRLVASGADVDARGARGQTALMWAVAQRQHEVVDTLLAGGADVHARSDVRTEVVKTTPEPWNPEYVTEIERGGYTALQFAARVGDVRSAQLLVAAGADVNDETPSGTSATVTAAHSGHGAVATFLLSHGANANAAGAGYTALHTAILHKDEALVASLLTYGADPNAPIEKSTPVRRDAVDFYLHPSWVGATPFWLAARFSAPSIMTVLAEHGADPLAVHRPTYWPGSLSVRDDRVQVQEGDVTALMAAVGLGGRSPLVAVDRLDRIAESAPVRSTRREPDPVLREAVTLDAVKRAVGYGIDIHTTNLAGDTALHGAAASGYASVVSYLIGQGARLDAVNANGKTPLDRATESSRGDSTVELLQRLRTENRR